MGSLRAPGLCRKLLKNESSWQVSVSQEKIFAKGKKKVNRDTSSVSFDDVTLQIVSRVSGKVNIQGMIDAEAEILKDTNGKFK